MSHSLRYPEGYRDIPKDERKALIYQKPPSVSEGTYLRTLREVFPEYFLLPWGGAVAGQRFGKIILMPFDDGGSKLLRETASAWENVLPCHLFPGGAIIRL